ncbi:MAG TPA: proton-conducting transporter membrane subunit [Lacibacter sp.]|nr:proton-conducting transporter membrane subunit [Lacibacter sp.]HMO89925.1 proton-conducting transporter membrane subunit [Lacibacter sp.]
MEFLLYSLFLLPVAVSGLLLLVPRALVRTTVVTAGVALAALAATTAFLFEAPVQLTVPPYVDQLVAGADLLLLLFFGWVAIRHRNVLVGLLAVLQLVGLAWLLSGPAQTHGAAFYVDRLSVYLYLLINVVSGIIAVYALRYMDEEPCSPFRRRWFLAILFWFVAAMNLVVSADNLEYFFLFFELTTLASFLFIGFRRDAVSSRNALTALWMNQLGGLAIIGAMLYLAIYSEGPLSFTHLLAQAPSDALLVPLALLCMAALVKGAQLPFSNWLLGAMVAPTPVSALLHSSTMVKIAPFVLLRLAPALQGTSVAMVVLAITAFGFVAAAIGALSQSNLKRILAHSTIALLALMMLLAAVATPVTMIAALLLLLFHGLSKALLFLNAGVLEKVFHLKDTHDMDHLGETGPRTALITIIGFVSLLLPPFGAFLGKWLTVESLGYLAAEHRIHMALLLVAIALGGGVLTLLYFKVMGVLLLRSGNRDLARPEHTEPVYSSTLYLLLALIGVAAVLLPLLVTNLVAPTAAATLRTSVVTVIAGGQLHIGATHLPLVPMAVALFLLPLTLVTALFIHFRKVDRVAEYACGEKVNYSISSFYFSTERAQPWLTATGLLLMVVLLAVAVF